MTRSLFLAASRGAAVLPRSRVPSQGSFELALFPIQQDGDMTPRTTLPPQSGGQRGGK